MSQRLGQVSGHLASFPRGLLAGEVAIITGAAQGIGRSAALLFAKEGAKVVVSDLDVKKAEIVVQEIKAAGGDAIAVGGDVGAEDFPDRILKATLDKYGKLNHIVNNAGFTYDKMIHTMGDDVFDVIMKVHVRAPFRLVRAAAPYLRIKGSKENRSIVNVSSTTGLHGMSGRLTMPPYVVSACTRFAPKFFFTHFLGFMNFLGQSRPLTHVNFIRTLAKEWGPFGVRANTIAFGLIQTRLTGAKAAGETIEVDGKKIALGFPGQPVAGNSANPIPLQRAGSADEACCRSRDSPPVPAPPRLASSLVSPLASYVSGHTLEVTAGLGI
ncbi:hypothetical protein BS47DRAFT_1398151 [Hydnum rufescens UP504]|uniref:NAD(P)-binding protein n=1 Tax=Hydnum rufescens UP504 TaxID=1448309 RepID=A0A9P6DMJ7_9AGAM|nr:hypothetical protein BS47DRAFT_1398151 [Hydnum rufescens UP504]